MSAILHRDYSAPTCFGHCGLCTTNIGNLMYATLSKVAKDSKGGVIGVLNADVYEEIILLMKTSPLSRFFVNLFFAQAG
jgi:hypothetical protein